MGRDRRAGGWDGSWRPEGESSTSRTGPTRPDPPHPDRRVANIKTSFHSTCRSHIEPSQDGTKTKLRSYWSFFSTSWSSSGFLSSPAFLIARNLFVLSIVMAAQPIRNWTLTPNRCQYSGASSFWAITIATG